MIRLLERASSLTGLLTASLLSTPAMAAGSNMPWEQPLQQILQSIEGPVSKIMAVIIICENQDATCRTMSDETLVSLLTASQWGSCRLDSPICLVALSGQAPQPRSGAPKARGLRANARTERPLLKGDARTCRTMSVESSTSLYTIASCPRASISTCHPGALTFSR